MDWTQGYTSRWRVDRVDPATWETCGTLYGVEEISVERDGTDEAPLLETASMTLTSAAFDAFEPGWHRIVMDATQGLVGEAVDIATVWLEAGEGEYDKGYRRDKLEGRSVLHQASDYEVGDGQYAPKGADGAEFAASLLRSRIDAPVHVDGSFRLADHVVFDLGASIIAAAWAVLREGGFCLQVDGRGEVHVIPMPTAPALAIDRAGSCIVAPKVSYNAGELTYTREWAPDVLPFSVVRGAIPERGLDGDYRVLSQRLTCSRGVTVEETVEVIA